MIRFSASLGERRARGDDKSSGPIRFHGDTIRRFVIRLSGAYYPPRFIAAPDLARRARSAGYDY